VGEHVRGAELVVLDRGAMSPRGLRGGVASRSGDVVARTVRLPVAFQPQPQGMNPVGSSCMWPTSPALPSQPVRTLPSTQTPAPIPDEMVRYTMSSGFRSEKKRSPMTPAVVSLWR